MNSAIWLPVAVSLLTCCLIMLFVWLWAVQIENGGVVDIFWSFNFPVIALILLFLAEGFQSRVYMICGMVVIWGVRLGSHLGNRVLSHLHEEEGRYAQLRKEWAPHADRKLFSFFQAQAVSNVFLAVPFFIITSNTAPQISIFEYLGLAVWIFALIGEATADWQLDRFKKNPSNKGKVCDVGFWNYSRHPNYFFEWLIWVSYFIFALGSPYGFIAVISPGIILYLLLNVTGIPATEEQSIRSKGERYKEYQKTTSAFVPWFKKS
jgi:steroid 5-alpha reductase family enzyme